MKTEGAIALNFVSRHSYTQHTLGTAAAFRGPLGSPFLPFHQRVTLAPEDSVCWR